MTYSGSEAAPADLAAAAPHSAQFEYGDLSDWRDTADLAAECERALRAMAARLADASTACRRTDAACADSLDEPGDAPSDALGPAGGPPGSAAGLATAAD